METRQFLDSIIETSESGTTFYFELPEVPER